MQAVVWALVGDGAVSGFTSSTGRPKVTGIVCDDFPPASNSNSAIIETIDGGVESDNALPRCDFEDRFASVELEGKLNRESFFLRRRRWRSGRSELTLHVGGRDLTGQSAIDTQRQLDSLFGGKLKAWSRFIYLASQGLDGLLRTSEATFSELLALLVPLDVWTAATATARLRRRALSKAADELDLVAAVRLRDVRRLLRRKRGFSSPDLLEVRPFNASSRGGTDADSTVKLASSKGEAHRDYKFESVLETSRDWLRDASQDYAGDLKQVAQLKRLVSLFQSRARFYRRQEEVLESAEKLLGSQGIQRNLLASVLRQLETQTNIYLEQASGGLLRLDFASSRTARMNKVLSVRGFDGAFRCCVRLRERTLQQASSGQRQLLALCLYLAFVVTIKRRAGLRCSVLFLDEPLLSLDSVNTKRVMKLLRSLVSKPQGSHLAEFESIFLTQHGLHPHNLRHTLDAVDTITLQGRSGHCNISTSVFLKHPWRAGILAL